MADDNIEISTRKRLKTEPAPSIFDKIIDKYYIEKTKTKL